MGSQARCDVRAEAAMGSASRSAGPLALLAVLLLASHRLPGERITGGLVARGVKRLRFLKGWKEKMQA